MAVYVDVRASARGKGVGVQQDSLPPARLRAPVRRIVARFAAVACPPEVRSGELTEGVLGEFELLLSVVPAGGQRMAALRGHLAVWCAYRVMPS